MTAWSLARPPQTAVLGDLFARSLAGHLVLVAGGAGLIGVLAQVAVPLPFTPVPLTGQTLGVLLVGSALGLSRALAATALYGIAGIAGLPWFAEGTSGWSAASVGYILGFVVAAGVAGWLAGRGWDRTPMRALLSMAAADAAILAVGATWLAFALDVGPWTAVTLGVLPFLIGDALKILVAAGLLPQAWQLAHRLSGSGPVEPSQRHRA